MTRSSRSGTGPPPPVAPSSRPSQAIVDGSLFEGEPLRPLTRDDIGRLIEAGSFGHEKFELMYGVVALVPVPSPEHEEAVYRVSTQLTLATGKRGKVRTRLSFAASDISQPLPDVLVAPPGNYWNEHPSRAYLAIEVSHGAPHRDHVLKLRMYAEAEVDEYWIVDLDQDVVIVNRERVGGRWRHVDHFVRGERIAPLALPDATIAVADVLPRG